MLAGGEPQADKSGHPLRRLAELVLAILENRLCLATVEFNLEKYQVIEVLFWGAAFFFLGLLAVLLLTLTVIVIFWDTARLAVLISLTLIYSVGAGGAFYIVKRRLKKWPPPFAETIAEIRKDRACLQTRKS